MEVTGPTEDGGFWVYYGEQCIKVVSEERLKDAEEIVKLAREYLDSQGNHWAEEINRNKLKRKIVAHQEKWKKR